MSDRSYLTTGEVAKLLDVTPQWVNRLANRGKIKSVRLGTNGWHRITAESVKAFASETNFELDWSLLGKQD